MPSMRRKCGLNHLRGALVLLLASTKALAQTTTSSATASTAASTTSIYISYSTGTATSETTPTSAPFPPVGSIPRDYSPSGLENIWSLVGTVTAPPFTTTPVPTASVILPSPPPPLYPTWYAPEPSAIFPNYKLPKGFKFGVATAAYQVEGAVKNEGKGPSVWDWASRQPDAIVDNSTADITDLHYFLYKEDAARMAALGVNAHSFSISWARIYPFGAADSPVNQAGLSHYSDVIDYHWSLGIEPVVTLFHWDTPLALVAYYGGFTSSQIVDDFVNYAKTVFQAYNGRVNTWYTFNEPRVYCSELGGYPFNTSFAPGINASTAPYQCYYNLLNAHAGAVKAFRAMGISGEIAFKNDDFVGQPWRANSTEDVEAVERHAAFQIGVFSNPVYTTGDWPEIVKETIPESYLPRFTEQQMQDLLGSADFFAIDSYRSMLIAAPPNGIASCMSNMSDPLWPACNSIEFYDSNAGWALGPSADPQEDSWLEATPQTLRYSLQQLHERWPTNKMYISEFGFAEPYEAERKDMFRITEDSTRTNYYMTYLGEALQSIYEDGIPLMGTFSWSIVDNAEWSSGFSTRFGIQYVNYTTLERTYKRSALALSEFFMAHLQ
ncbi:glycoside hydrolase family 1 protein [Jaapia argillacea MUCL 33604]|uniref:Glycoside hydrolase family 1 protein n=1 Tax=Jaapia argillacea MUCL 33604 TaxID=933084 RepID=A0A067PYV3_9AGAM|nr:glycoside hydrolase family 1 protein [Jaapia argillacea MUCL 33604]